MKQNSNRNRSTRRGVTSVELALIALPLFMFSFAAIEFGRAFMTVQALEEAARAGCRVAILKGSSSSAVEAEIQKLTNAMGISNATTEILPATLDEMPQWDPVTVRISANFSDMSWLPLPEYFSGYSYTASCVFPREGDFER